MNGATHDSHCAELYDQKQSLTTNIMSMKLKVGDHVTWNSDAGHVSGRIIRVHTQDADYKGYTHHASPDDPQYEIESDATEHIAMHKGVALTKALRGAHR